jgi:hypothetical protein
LREDGRQVLDEAEPSAEDSFETNDLSSLSPVRKKRSRAKKFLAAGGGLAVMLAVAAFFAYRPITDLLRRRTRALPVIAERLPPQTQSIEESRLRADLDEMAVVPGQYVASLLAEIACGGDDMAQKLGLARGKDLDVLQASGVLDMLSNQRAIAALRCGESIRKGLAAPTRIVISFVDGDKTFEVSVMRTRSEALELGSNFVRHSFSGLDGWCQRYTDSKEDCADERQAAAHDRDIWMFGRVPAVEAFVRTYTSVRQELTTAVDILRDTAGQTSEADWIAIRAKPESIPWIYPCEQVAPIEHKRDFDRACFPSGMESVLASITPKVRGLAIERHVLGTAGGYALTYVLLTRDDEAARGVEKDLMDLARDWRAQIVNGEAALVKLIRAPSKYVHDDLWKVAIDPFLRAMRGGEVSRSANVVRLTFATSFQPAESKMLKEFVERRTEDQLATVAVIDALISGGPVPAASLGVFVGPEVAAFMLAPRATDAQCETIRRKLGTLTSVGVPPEMFGTKLAMERRYGKQTCTGIVLPPESEACLVRASSLGAFAACQIPASPFVLSATRKLEGQWDVDNVTVANAEPPSEIRAAFAHAKLEFEKGRVAFRLGNKVLMATSDVQASEVGKASFDLPVPKGTSRTSLVFVNADTIKLTVAEVSIEFACKRAKLEKSLFAEPSARAVGATSGDAP